MNGRIEEEIELLRDRYGDVTPSDDGQHIVVHNVDVADGWNRDTTDVLIELKNGYPDTPPDNFWVPAGLRPESGGTPGDLSAGHKSYQGESWDRFSWHAEDGDWWPHPDIEDGSNLLTFMGTVEDRLSEVQ